MEKTEYNVILKGQFSPKKGTLTLQVIGAEVQGFFDFQGQKSHFRGKVIRRNRYVASLSLILPQATQDCDVLLVVGENQILQGGLVDNWGCWPIEGTPIRHQAWQTLPSVQR
ncbi:hypothetical protein RFF05_10425 [Bengtsoniella intestinalis]|uniref:hypothetical protein n=1 Tax=Bengtsoniella intestinalis TaxID=3073143 RepID=UPI00391FA50F